MKVTLEYNQEADALESLNNFRRSLQLHIQGLMNTEIDQIENRKMTLRETRYHEGRRDMARALNDLLLSIEFIEKVD